jgi:N-acetylglucosamine malate deacetylase 2
VRESCLIVAPHPDDETIGAGIWMARHRDIRITLLHITDGSPREPSDALAAGFASCKAYADERRRELDDAVSLIRIGPEQLRRFSYVDKESHLHIPELIERMTALIRELQPTAVLSPAYEGGHPDHDTTAFAVAVARRHITQSFCHLEYRLYHAGPNGAMVTDEFLPQPMNHVEVCPHTRDEQQLKRRMLACFRTQQHILREFSVKNEQFRPAPSYDFARPPHDGMLMYEQWGWAISGKEWRDYAAEAEDMVGSPAALRDGAYRTQ